MSSSLPVVKGQTRTDDDRRMHPYCQECKLACEAKGKDWSKVTSYCHGVYSEEDFEAIAEKAEVPVETVEELYNPRTWFAKNLQMVPYWYQDRAIRCTSARKAFRWGRRCVVAGTPVLMADGSWRAIEVVKKGEYVATRNEKAQIVPAEVTLEHDNGIKEVYRITLTTGMSIDCTANHPLLTMETGFQKGARRVWKSIEDGLSVGDRVFTIAGFNTWGDVDDKDAAALLGYLVTDGYIGGSGQTPKFTNNNPAMIEEVRILSQKLYDYDCTVRTKGRGFDVYITDGNRGTANQCSVALAEQKVIGQKAARKTVPADFWRWNKASVMRFINRMFSGDGCASVGTSKNGRTPAELSLVSTSRDILKDIRLALMKIDVLSRITTEKRVTNKSGGQESVLHKLHISDAASVEAFFKSVGLIYGKEEQSLAVLDAVRQRSAGGRRKVRGKHCSHYKIKSIKPLGPHHTYDIGVKKYHNYIADGMIAHNTGKTQGVAAWLCQMAFVHRKVKILCITPMKSQAKEIFDRLLQFFEDNPELAKETKSKQQPYYEISFRNLSRIRIFVAGTASGSGAATQVRGQEADIIFIDEMDYLDDDASKAILPVLSDPPRVFERVHFIGSSTPTGKEGVFFKICNDDYYREFHFPSRSRPDWNERMESECRSLAKTKTNYDHEYEAEWGSKVDGVFKRNDIIKACQEYRYFGDKGMYEEAKWPQMKPWPHWKYIMGVDWNGAGTGTRIVVLGFDPARSKWCVVYREVSETALHIASARVVEVNREWACHAVYLDSGYGQMQDEWLRGIGRTAEVAKSRNEDYNVCDLTLAHNLHSVDFGGWIKYKIRNPQTKKMVEVKKRIKNYMVEHLQSWFELEDIWFSKNDADLKQELMGYTVARQDQHGQLIYKGDPELGDHDLDALLLAAYGFNQQFDPLFAGQTDSTIIVHRRPGQAESEAPDAPDPFTQPAKYRKHQEEKAAENARRRGADIPSRGIKPTEQTRTPEHGPGWQVVRSAPAQTRGRVATKIPNRNAWRAKGGRRGRGRGI